jgi:hypothetical protein
MPAAGHGSVGMSSSRPRQHRRRHHGRLPPRAYHGSGHPPLDHVEERIGTILGAAPPTVGAEYAYYICADGIIAVRRYKLLPPARTADALAGRGQRTLSPFRTTEGNTGYLSRWNTSSVRSPNCCARGSKLLAR